MAGFALRALTVLLGVPFVLSWLWLAKTYDQFWLAIFLLVLITTIASWEYAKLIEKSKIPLEPYSFAAVSVLTTIAYGTLGDPHTSLIFTASALLFVTAYLPHPDGVRSGATAALGLLYIPYLLHFVYPLYQSDQGFYHVLVLLLLVWAYDTGAYIMGSLFGRHKLFPVLSPKKSWEGVIGGWALAIVAGSLSLLWIPWRFPMENVALHALALSLLIGIATQLGDLFESKLKRTAHAKDSGVFFPGHGGMLDRIDGLLFALPVFYSYAHYVLKWV